MGLAVNHNKSVVLPLLVSFSFGGSEHAIYPTAIISGNEVILVDACYPNQLELLIDAAGRAGVALSELSKVVITHHDYDHMGSLAALKRNYPQVAVVTSAADANYVSGKQRSLRLQQAESIFSSIPDTDKPQALAFQQMLESIESVDVDVAVADGDCVDALGDVVTVETPGHMPGHISLYVKSCKTLIAGDALVVEGGQLAIANPQFTLSMEQAKESLCRLLQLDVDTVVCYHGGVFRGDWRSSVARLVD